MSYKSALTNCRNGNIKHFNIIFLKQKKDTHIMNIEQQYFNKDTICKTKLGNISHALNKQNNLLHKQPFNLIIHYILI